MEFNKKNSTRVLNKNVRRFGNTTLLDITLQKLCKLDNLYKIIVSSNCEDSQKIASKYKKVIFSQRSEKFCTSNCIPSEWNCELAKLVIKHGGEHILFSHCVCPFIEINTYQGIINNYINLKIKLDLKKNLIFKKD
jgi:hypothetical protein